MTEEVTNTEGGISYGRTALIILGIVAGAATAFYGQPLIHGNEQATNVIVTAFTVLAGFLVAIITIIGDPSALLPGSWRIASSQRRLLRRRLRRQQFLFYIYLLTLGIIFVAALIGDAWPCVTTWLERVYLFFGVAGFVWSLGLPSALMSIQEERVEAVIQSRKKGRDE